MRLQKLSMKNFQGCLDETINLDNKNVSIYGDNGTGKTTVANAILWLLADTTVRDIKSFTPKRINEDGIVHKTETMVSAVIDDHEYSRSLNEVYRNLRGTTREMFFGNTSEYTVDGIPMKQKEFEVKVKEYTGLSKDELRLLLLPSYFAETMSWQDRRKLLLEICGDVSDEKVLMELMRNELPKGFVQNIRDYGVDAFKKSLKKQRTDLKKKTDGVLPKLEELRYLEENVFEDDEDVITKLRDRYDVLYYENLSDKSALEECEANEEHCDAFLKTKMELIEGNINRVFHTCRFKLVEEQLNGVQKECCEVLVYCDGKYIPYTNANNASRINAGIEIISILSDYFKVKPFIIVDNAEGVTKIANVDNQVIRLVVSEQDKKLRVEYD